MEYEENGHRTGCPLKWLDNFSMRNFTNATVFDDTLPVSVGRWKLAPRSLSISCKRPWRTGSGERVICRSRLG